MLFDGCEVAEKRCAVCGAVRPMSMFSTNRRRSDGKCAQCKECDRARHSKIKAGLSKNPAALSAHLERKNAKSRALYQLRKSDPAEYAKERERRRRAERKWRYSLPAHHRLVIKSNKVRRWASFSLTREWADGQLARQGGRCYWTGIPLDLTGRNWLAKPSLDRLTPGGPYSPDNVVLACMFANTGRMDAGAGDFDRFLSELADSLPAYRNAGRT